MTKKIVIKIGSDNIASENGLNYKRIISLARDISILHHLGYQILVVSSGAVASGAQTLGVTKIPKEISEKRVLAAVGQCYLMEAWIKALFPLKVAQTLLTWSELENINSRKKAKETLNQLLNRGIVPIVNENDAIADEELRYSDNDQMAVRLAKIIKADRLIILTNVDGLFTKDPKHSDAKLITKINQENKNLFRNIKKTKSKFGTGGMYSKVIAAGKAIEANIITNIINGSSEGSLVSLIRDNKQIGTEFSNF